MAREPNPFDDGAAYDRWTGNWSLLAGKVFLDWLQPASGLRWIDVGCGSGAFSELLVWRSAPAEIQGIDPSEAQLTYARTRAAARGAVFRQGDTLALPFDDNRFDAAAMARVVRPGGMVAAYAWDVAGGALPNEPPAPNCVAR